MLTTGQGTKGYAFRDSGGDSGGGGDGETACPLLAEEAAPGCDKELQHPTPSTMENWQVPMMLAFEGRKADPSCPQLRALSQVPLECPIPTISSSPQPGSHITEGWRGSF